MHEQGAPAHGDHKRHQTLFVQVLLSMLSSYRRLCSLVLLTRPCLAPYDDLVQLDGTPVNHYCYGDLVSCDAEPCLSPSVKGAQFGLWLINF